MFDPIDLSFYEDAILDELVSGEPKIDGTILWYIQRCHEHWDSADGESVRPPRHITLRYIMPQDLEALLHYNGFKVVGRYSDYRGDPITQEEPGYIYLCEKRYQRIITLPLRQVDYAGAATLVISYQSVNRSHQLDLLFDRHSLSLLALQQI